MNGRANGSIALLGLKSYRWDSLLIKVINWWLLTKLNCKCLNQSRINKKLWMKLWEGRGKLWRTCFIEKHFHKLDDRTTGTKAQKYSLLIKINDIRAATRGPQHWRTFKRFHFVIAFPFPQRRFDETLNLRLRRHEIGAGYSAWPIKRKDFFLFL